MPRQLVAAVALDVENEYIKASQSGDGGVLLPERACRSIAGIFKWFLAVLLLLADKSGKDLLRHIHLAPDLDCDVLFKAQRDGIDRPEICRDILAGHAVAPGGAAHKHAVLIFERNGKAVYLRLDNELRLRELLPDPRYERFDLAEAERILEALERHGVGDRLKHSLGAAADSLSGQSRQAHAGAYHIRCPLSRGRPRHNICGCDSLTAL